MVKAPDGGVVGGFGGQGPGCLEVPDGSTHVRSCVGPTTPGYARLGFIEQSDVGF